MTALLKLLMTFIFIGCFTSCAHKVSQSNAKVASVKPRSDADKLCKSSSGFEPWTYHRNIDGTYGLVGMNVVIAEEDVKWIKLKRTSICGHVIIKGYVSILDSYIQGSDDKNAPLIIDNSNAKELALTMDEVTSMSLTGRISGPVLITKSTFSGSIEMDAVLGQSKERPIQITRSEFSGKHIVSGKFRSLDSKIKGSISFTGDKGEGITVLGSKLDSLDNPRGPAYVKGYFLIERCSVEGSMQMEDEGKGQAQLICGNPPASDK